MEKKKRTQDLEHETVLKMREIKNRINKSLYGTRPSTKIPSRPRAPRRSRARSRAPMRHKSSCAFRGTAKSRSLRRRRRSGSGRRASPVNDNVVLIHRFFTRILGFKGGCSAPHPWRRAGRSSCTSARTNAYGARASRPRRARGIVPRRTIARGGTG